MFKRVIVGVVAAASIAAVSTAWAADTASQKFLKEAIEGNLAEVDMGKLAQDKGQSDAVKSFGQMLVTDHTDANTKAMAAASTLNVTAPTEPNKKQKAMHDKLAKMSGTAFDKEFAKEMVADHKKDISDYQKESKMRQSDAAVDYAKDALPTLQKHLETAQSIVSGKSASK